MDVLKERLFRIYKEAAQAGLEFAIATGLARLPVIRAVVRWADAKVRSFLAVRPVGVIRVHGIVINTRGAGGAVSDEMRYGTHDWGVVQLFHQVLKPGMTVIDVGAHIGYFTLLAAKLVEHNGRVYAFEPDPDNWRTLSYNTQLNGLGNVEAIPKAVSDHSGKAELWLSKASEQHSLSKPGARPDVHGSIIVETVNLDEFLEERGWPSVDLVKIDVEGHEPAVLSGMTRLIKRSEKLAVVMELNRDALIASGHSPLEFLGRIQTSGLGISIVREKGGLEPLDINRLTNRMRIAHIVNLFCEK
jgi:FkbM family methyltransferase